MKKMLILALATLMLVACHKKPVIETEQFTAEETTYLNGESGDSLYIHFEIEYPTVLENMDALRNIQHSLTGKLLGDKYASLYIEDAMQRAIEVYQAEYKQSYIPASSEETPDIAEEEESFYASSELEILTGRVMSILPNTLSYGMEQYVYTGGAHGISNRYFYNYDMTTGALLSEEDIFIDDYKAALTTILRHNLITQNPELHDLDDLYRSAYEVEDIVPNNNFYLTEEGIIYVFNPYEIAPYAYGGTDISVSKAELKPLLQSDIHLW